MTHHMDKKPLVLLDTIVMLLTKVFAVENIRRCTIAMYLRSGLNFCIAKLPILHYYVVIIDKHNTLLTTISVQFTPHTTMKFLQ